MAFIKISISANFLRIRYNFQDLLFWHKIKIEKIIIKVVKILSALKSVRDIQIILGFINFYKRFNKNFNKIAASFISLLQITKLTNNNILNI